MGGDFWVAVGPIGKEIGDGAGVVGPAGEFAGEGPGDRWGEALVPPAPVDQLPVEGAAAGLVQALGVAVDVRREVGKAEIITIPWGPIVEVLVSSGREMVFYEH